MVVLDVQKVGGATDAEASLISDAIAERLTRIGVFQIVTQRDIATLLGVERQKQLLGCGEDSASCMTELTGALDARFTLSGQLNRLGGTYQLTLTTLDARKGQPTGRSLKAAKTMDDLRALLPWAIAEATGTPAPKPPSRVGPTLLMVGGGLGLAAGGVVAFRAFTQEAAIQRELKANDPNVLRYADDYRAEADDIKRNKDAALLMFAVGAGLAGAGAWWWFSQPDVSSGRVAIIPTGSGVAIVGELP